MSAALVELLIAGGGWFYLGRQRSGLIVFASTAVVGLGLVWAGIVAPALMWPLCFAFVGGRIASSVMAGIAAGHHAPHSRIGVLILAGIELLALIALHENVLAAVNDSPAMTPTLQTGDRLFIEHLSPADPIDVGEIVMFLDHNDKLEAKRVVAGPGQHVVVRGNDVVVAMSGVTVTAEADSDRGPFTLMADTYFLAGDNRDASRDSRHFGPVPRERIVGKVTSVWWSHDGDGFHFDRFGLPIR